MWRGRMAEVVQARWCEQAARRAMRHGLGEEDVARLRADGASTGDVDTGLQD